jgi:ATP-dependent RNA helicase DeaD
MKFTELNLKPQILDVLNKIGFTEASEIQELAIPIISTGVDFLGLANTGTGKTAAFCLPILNTIRADKSLQVLILAPTRELAQQIETECFKFGKDLGINTLSVYGGSSYTKQISFLKRGVEMVVATPGRLIDLLEKRALNLDKLTHIVLDEADEMLNMGFLADIEGILKLKPQSAQTLLFSATMSPNIQAITKKFLKTPKMVDIASKNLTKDNITQNFFAIKSDHKLEVIKQVLLMDEPKLCIVFTNTKTASLDVAIELQNLGIKAEAINGDLSQKDREMVMKRFKTGFTKVLVATDVAARGIDVKEVDVVINFDLPFEKEYYIHRIGRTGRAGRQGASYSFVCNGKDKMLLRNIEFYSKFKITEKTPYTKTELAQKRFTKLQNAFVDYDKIDNKYKDILTSLVHTYTLEEVALNLLNISGAVEDQEITSLKALKDSGTNMRGSRDESRGPREFRPRNVENMGQIAISVGKADRISPTTIVAFIKNLSDTFPKNIGDIDIFKDETLVQVPLARIDKIQRALDQKDLRGKIVSVKIVN